MSMSVFDDWPDRYRQWFDTPLGAVIKRVEIDLVMSMLQPNDRHHVLDAGCGCGIFTAPIIARGARATGIDLSRNMLGRAVAQLPSGRFSGVAADMLALPFPDRCFDHAISITALEFIADGGAAIRELFRVTRPGGRVLAATLNSLSPWAQRRAAAARVDPGSVFRHARFRSPHELMAMAPVPGEWRTAIFFDRRSTPDTATAMENATIDRGHGAFLAGLWTRPG